MTKTGLGEILGDDLRIRIHSAEEYDLTEPEPSYFSDQGKERCMRFLKELQDFLSYPCYEDDFQSDHERYGWISGMYEKHGDIINGYYYKNALRWGIVSSVPAYASFLVCDYVGPDKELFEKVVHSLSGMAITKKEYDSSSPQEKVAYVMQVKQGLYELLRTLSKD